MSAFHLFFFLLFLSCSVRAQDFSSYEKPLSMGLFSEKLNDSVSLEITLPKELKNQSGKEYPIIYLLDRQLSSNYAYNLSTIDYLSTLQWMPNSIVVGITFSYKNRNSWTVPNESGGKADDFIFFIEKELNNELKKKYPISNFNLLIGHSRTAIFSSYALSTRPDFFNGIIASSVSNFDFGDEWQQKQFEAFLNKIPSSSHKYYYYFSVGEKAYGDLHEPSVDTLNAYLNSKKLPANLEWNYSKHQIAHELTPGVTVGKALSDIFKAYGKRIDVCFDLAKGSISQVPWNDFDALYSKISSELGFKIEPDELFFNSVASEYYNDYDGIYGENNLGFTLEILLKAIEKYPKDYSYYSWIGEIYVRLKECDKGEDYLNKAIELLNKDKTVSKFDRKTYRNEIEALKKMNELP